MKMNVFADDLFRWTNNKLLICVLLSGNNDELKRY